VGAPDTSTPQAEGNEHPGYLNTSLIAGAVQWSTSRSVFRLGCTGCWGGDERGLCTGKGPDLGLDVLEASSG
jgi:hypothetical protein